MDATTASGIIVARAHEEKLYMLNGNHLGKHIISGIRAGVFFQSHSPKSASQYFVNTLILFIQLFSKSHRRADFIKDRFLLNPDILSAK